MDEWNPDLDQTNPAAKKNSKRTTLILLAVILVVLVGGVFLYNRLSSAYRPEENLTTLAEQPAESLEEEPAQPGEEEPANFAPDFTVLDREGNPVKLSDLRGKPVVLNFWASWCPPCKSEMPDFDKVWQELGEDVHFMMVDLVDASGQETVESGTAYVDEAGFGFPVYFDVEQEAAYAYGVRSIPTTYFIDAQGRGAAWASGAITEEQLRIGIEKITEQE